LCEDKPEAENKPQEELSQAMQPIALPASGNLNGIHLEKLAGFLQKQALLYLWKSNTFISPL
jgi:hypothetical protein